MVWNSVTGKVRLQKAWKMEALDQEIPVLCYRVWQLASTKRMTMLEDDLINMYGCLCNSWCKIKVSGCCFLPWSENVACLIFVTKIRVIFPPSWTKQVMGPGQGTGDFFSTQMSKNMNNGKLNFSDTCDYKSWRIRSLRLKMQNWSSQEWRSFLGVNTIFRR